MRTTIFHAEDGTVRPEREESPSWEPFEEFEGEPLEQVRLVELLEEAPAEIQLVEIGAGGHFAMHSSPELAFCQVVHGRGKLGLPDGTELTYQGPELYVFRPNTLHDWHDIEEDTVLAVCLVQQ